MVAALELELRNILSFVAGIVILASAVFVFAMRPGSHLGRSLALLLFVLAFYFGLFGFAPSIGDPASQMRMYFRIAIPFAAAYFAAEFILTHRPRPAGESSPWAVVPYAMLIAGAGFELFWILRPEVFMTTFEPGPPPRNVYGLEEVFSGLDWLSLAGLALLFAFEASRPESGAARRSWFMGSLAFALLSAFTAASFTFNFTMAAIEGEDWVRRTLESPYAAFSEVSWPVALLMTGAAAAFLFRGAQPGSAERRDATWFAIAASFAALTGITTMLILRLKPIDHSYAPQFLVYGLWQLVLPVLLLSPALRTKVFDIDHKVKVTIRRATVATVFVAVFFAATEVAAEKLSDASSVGIGAVAAGLLLFAAHPLQRMAERVAYQTLPKAKALDKLSEAERLALYREQAELAWMDGSLQRKERLLLDRLRQRLGVSVAEAAGIEREAIHGSSV